MKGWHNVFYLSFKNVRNTIQIFIEKLGIEEEATRIKLIRYENGERPNIKRKYRILNEDLFLFINYLEVDYGVNFVFNLINYLYINKYDCLFHHFICI